MEAPVNYDTQTITSPPAWEPDEVEHQVIEGELAELAGDGLWCSTCGTWRTLVVLSRAKGRIECAYCGAFLPVDEGLSFIPVYATTQLVAGYLRPSDESLPDAPYTEQTDEDSHTDDEIRALLHRVANRLDHLVAILEKEHGR